MTLGSYYILLKIHVWENHVSGLSQEFGTTLRNLKVFAVIETSSESVPTVIKCPLF